MKVLAQATWWITIRMRISMAPIIGITTYDPDEKIVDTKWYDKHFCSPALYVDAVRRAGGIPVLLPVGEEKIDRLLATLDALIITGGPRY